MASVPSTKRHPYDQWSPDARALDIVGDKWTLLIVRDLVGGPRRFVEIQRTRPGISPEQLRTRLLALRAFDAEGMMIAFALVKGRELEGAIETQLAAPSASYLHVHYAAPGCYAARVDRA